MKSEIDEFATSFSLSPREKEVFVLLTRKIIHFKDIAIELGLSPSTVNNHFKSIFEKTGTNSKSELLAAFLRHVAQKLNHCRHLGRKPRVLIVDDEPDICEFIAEALTQRGMKVYCHSDPAEALRSIASTQLDAIILDICMPNMDGIEFLREVRRTHHYFPSVYFVSGVSRTEDLDQLMDMGAVGFLEKPIDMNRLFNLIMEQIIIDEVSEHIPTVLNGCLQLETQSIGFGGIFISLPAVAEKDPDLLQTLQVGSRVSFQFKLGTDTDPIPVTGEIVWRRDMSKGNLRPGMGVKFVKISEQDRERVLDHARLNQILSFIPMGKAVI